MEQNKFDLSRLTALAVRHKWLYIVSLVFCLGAAGLYLYRTPKTYAVSAQILVEDEEGGGSMLKALSLGGAGADVEDEVQVMDAHKLLAQAVKETGIDHSYYKKQNLLKTVDLYKKSPLKLMAAPEVLDTLSELLTFRIEVDDKGAVDIDVKKSRFGTIAEARADRLPVTVKTPYGLYTVDTTAFYKPGDELDIIATVTSPDLMAQSLDKVSVTRSSKKSNAISLYAEDNVSKRAVDLLNKMIEIYNRWSQEKKDKTALNTARFIDERLRYIYDELNASEADIENFKQDNRITDVQAETGMGLQKRQQLETQLTGLETQSAVLKMTRDFVTDPRTKFEMIPFIEGTDNAVTVEYNRLISQRMSLLQSAKPGNKAVEALDEQIAAIRENVISSVDRSLKTNTVRANEIKAVTGASSAALGKVPEQERQYRELLRQQTVKNSLYSFLLEKREENQLLLAASMPKGHIIDEAWVHKEPVAPKGAMVIFLGLVLGIVMPSFYLYVRNLLNNKFENQDELSRLTSVPVAGEMAHSRRAATQNLVIHGNSVDPVAELFRLLRSNLAFMLPAPADGKGSVIAITSSIGGEGKSFIASNLAETLALGNKRVVLVGYDIRKPMLAKYLDLRPEPGITNYLSDPSVTVDQLIQHKEDFSVIVAGPIPPNPTELLLGKRTGESLERLREMFDYVLVDTAPLGLVSDSFSLIKYADLTLYVTRARYTLKNHIKMLNRYVEDKRLANVAIVINDVHLDRNAGYGYGYSLDDKEA